MLKSPPAEEAPRLQMVWRLQEKPAQVLNMLLQASLSLVRDRILGWTELWSNSVLFSFSSEHFFQTAKTEDRFPGISKTLVKDSRTGMHQQAK